MEVSHIPYDAVLVESGWVIWKTPWDAEIMLPRLAPPAFASVLARFFAFAVALAKRSSFRSSSFE